jgi:CPA2 family monovalent cation:H+ antiporter-2
LNAIGQLGVVFLLFVVGLDFTPERLKRLGRTLIVGGSMQTVLTIALAALVSLTEIISLTQAILVAFIVIQSSTAIALKVYQERGEIRAPHAELSIGICLFQDIATVFLLILIPVLGVQAGGANNGSLMTTGQNFLILGAIVVAAYFLIPLLLRLVLGTGIRELVVLLGIVLCLGFAGITQNLGFSLALGSFICGLLLSRSEFHTQITADIAPFKDVFLSLFFISIGLEYNWSFAIKHAGSIIALTFAVMLAKTGILFLSSRALRFPLRTSLITAAGLSNIGEFGFVIMISSLSYGLLSKEEFQTLGSAAIYSMLLTPFFINIIAKATLRINAQMKNSEIELPATLPPKVIIVGYGLAGKHLSQVLKSSSIPYNVVEINGQIAREAREKGEPVLFGDATQRDILEHCGVKTAQVVVFLISDSSALKASIGIVRQIVPGILIMCRTRRMVDIEPLMKAGADEVVSEEFETSIELFTIVLTRMHVPRNIIRAQTRVLREDGYEMLRVPAPVQGISDKLAAVLAAGTTDVFQVMEGQFAVKKSLQELALRSATGVTVIAIVRDEKSMTNPPANFTLQVGDALVIVGSHAQIEATFSYLEGKQDS